MWSATVETWAVQPQRGRGIRIGLACVLTLAILGSTWGPAQGAAPGSGPTAWTQLGGNAARAGFAGVSEGGIWKVQTDGTRITSTPAIAYGNVYIGAGNATVAYDAVTGALVWRTVGDGPAAGSPAVVDGVVYNGCSFDLCAYDATTGALKWRFKTGGDAGPYIGAPAVVEGLVYLTFYRTVFAVDAATGTSLWQTAVGDGAEQAAGVAVADDTVYVQLRGSMVTSNTWNGYVMAFNATTGAQVWRTLSPYAMQGEAEPAVACGVVFAAAGTGEGHVLAFDAKSGSLLWDHKMAGTGSSMVSPVAVARGTVYANFDGHAEALDAVTGTARWTRSLNPVGSSYSGPSVAGGIVYIHYQRALYALDEATGAPRWTAAVGMDDYTTPVPSGGAVYFAADEFDANGASIAFLQSLEATTGSSLPGPTAATAAVADECAWNDAIPAPPANATSSMGDVASNATAAALNPTGPGAVSSEGPCAGGLVVDVTAGASFPATPLVPDLQTTAALVSSPTAPALQCCTGAAPELTAGVQVEATSAWPTTLHKTAPTLTVSAGTACARVQAHVSSQPPDLTIGAILDADGALTIDLPAGANVTYTAGPLGATVQAEIGLVRGLPPGTMPAPAGYHILSSIDVTPGPAHERDSIPEVRIELDFDPRAIPADAEPTMLYWNGAAWTPLEMGSSGYDIRGYARPDDVYISASGTSETAAWVVVNHTSVYAVGYKVETPHAGWLVTNAPILLLLVGGPLLIVAMFVSWRGWTLFFKTFRRP